jgi:DNA gyrase subunit A
MQLSELSSVRVTGIMAMQLEKGDELGWARLTRGEDEVILVSAHGQALRLAEKVMRPMGRQAGGTAGIRLDKDDQVVSLEVVEPGAELLVVTVKGYGKRSPIKEYPVKGRATSGVASIDQKNLPKIGPVAAARIVQKGDDVIIITGGGMVLRLKAKDVVSTGRARRGEHLMDVAASDQVASIARLAVGEQ